MKKVILALALLSMTSCTPKSQLETTLSGGKFVKLGDRPKTSGLFSYEDKEVYCILIYDYSNSSLQCKFKGVK